MKPIKIALLQLPPERSVAEALRSGIAACREAAANRADVAIFPELWNTGYTFFDPREPGARAAWIASAVQPSSKFVSEFRDMARRLRLAIGITYLEVHDPRPRNSLSLFDREGELALHYSKVHLCTFGFEAYCCAGDRFPVCTLQTSQGPVRVGAMICFDREFPESARVLTLQGAELVLVPNACLFDEHRTEQMKTRAFENKIALAMANYPDSHPESNGRSLAVSPIAWERKPADSRPKFRKTLLLEAGAAAGIFYCEFDLDAIREYRRNAIWGASFRKPNCYTSLVDPDLIAPYEGDLIIS